MTTDTTFADYTTRLRDFIRRHSAGFAIAKKLPPADGDQEFNELARALFQLQFACNVPYRRWCEARNVPPESVSHWTQIPAIPTVAFKELELTCLAPGGRTAVFHSSGTTEHKPSRHFHNAESLAVYEASLRPWFQAHLLADLEPAAKLPMVLLTPDAIQAPCSSLVHMFEMLRRAFGSTDSWFTGAVDADSTWKIDFDAALRALQQAMERNRPVVLLGTAFNFVHLLDDFGDRDLRLSLPGGSRAMETGGYKGRSRSLHRSELHALITDRLGIPATHIVCEYGMSELSSQAYDQTIGSTRNFRFPPWARAQVVSTETGREVCDGETGLLRVWDLANVASVMAIQTEDLCRRCGDGFELLGRAALAEARGCSLMTV